MKRILSWLFGFFRKEDPTFQIRIEDKMPTNRRFIRTNLQVSLSDLNQARADAGRMLSEAWDSDLEALVEAYEIIIVPDGGGVHTGRIFTAEKPIPNDF